MKLVLVVLAKNIKIVTENCEGDLVLDVAVGVIFNQAGEVLITQRSPMVACPNLWEFPGGKIESTESPEQALKRELKEEVDIDCLKIRPWLVHQHAKVRLHVFYVKALGDRARLMESQQALAWVEVNELESYAFPEGNNFLVQQLACREGTFNF